MSTKISITLSSANMGDVSEADFDAWANYVAEHIESALGFKGGTVDVDQRRFGEAGPDLVGLGSSEDRERVREWLSHEGWDAFCATPEAWSRADGETPLAALQREVDGDLTRFRNERGTA